MTSSTSPVDLPVELWDTILQRVNLVRDLKAVSLSCRLFHSLVKDKIWSVSRTSVRGSQIGDIADLPVVTLRIVTDSCNDDHLSQLGSMHSLQVLDLWGNDDVTDTGISRLTGLRLRELNVVSCGLDDVAVSTIGGMVSLEVLNMSDNPAVTAAGISQLADLTLRELNVGHCELGDAALSSLGGMTSLQVLDMYDNPAITDSGISMLTGLAHLTALYIGDTKVTDVGLCHLLELHSLTKLDVACCSRVTDTGLAELLRLDSLRELNRYGCSGVTDAVWALFPDHVELS